MNSPVVLPHNPTLSHTWYSQHVGNTLIVTVTLASDWTLCLQILELCTACTRKRRRPRQHNTGSSTVCTERASRQGRIWRYGSALAAACLNSSTSMRIIGASQGVVAAESWLLEDG